MKLRAAEIEVDGIPATFADDGIAREYHYPEHSEYPYHDRTILVTRCGRICMEKCKISLSRISAGQYIGVIEIDDDIWLVSFMDYDLGFFDRDRDRVEPSGENPFTPKVLPMSPEWTFEKMAHPARLERATCGFEVRRSIQLSYGCAD
jgi:hypothetical protein